MIFGNVFQHGGGGGLYFGGVRTFSHHQSFYREWIRILDCGQGRIDSVKINPSLPMMRE